MKQEFIDELWRWVSEGRREVSVKLGGVTREENRSLRVWAYDYDLGMGKTVTAETKMDDLIAIMRIDRLAEIARETEELTKKAESAAARLEALKNAG